MNKPFAQFRRFTAVLGVLLFVTASSVGCNTQPPAQTSDSAPAVTTAPASAHIFGDWEITKAATLETVGERVKKCTHCEETVTESYSINSPEYGIDEIHIHGTEDYCFSASYTAENVTFVIRWNQAAPTSADLYLTANGNTELINSEAYCVSLYPSGTTSVKSYGSRKFATDSRLSGMQFSTTDNTMTLTVPYAAMGTTKDACKLAFYPVIQDASGSYSYTQINPFVVNKYAETWLCVNSDNRIYYNDTYQSRHIENWQKPSFSDPETMIAGVIKESSVEEAIIAIAIAESKGATGYDLHMNYLNDKGLLTAENIERIVTSTNLPMLALFYDSDQTQETRMNGLLLAVQAGAAAVDLQGYMGWSGSSKNTQTDANVKYWEDLGYDMCFVKASPAETILDVNAIQTQKAFIEKVHATGSQVLMSAHVNTIFSAKQALAFAEFSAARGFDFIKIVGDGQSKIDVLECVEACKLFGESEKLKDVKVSFHLSGSNCVYITRVICPVFYGSYIAFCYPELTTGQDANQLDLDMAIEVFKAAKDASAGKDLSVDDAIALVEKYSSHEQLVKLIHNYRSTSDTVGYIYGTNAAMDDRWTFSQNNYTVQLRGNSSTNSYTTRAYAYDSSNNTSEQYISATVTADFIPYVSATRQPRAGLFIGTAENMLAFTYNADTKKLELCSIKDGWVFGASKNDPSKADALQNLGLIESQTYSTDIASGGKVKMAMHLTDGALELYFAEGNGELQKVGTVAAAEVSKYLTDSNCFAGVVSEIYMGSVSAGRVNTLTFSDVAYEQ